MKKIAVLSVVAIAVLLLLPLSAAALTNSETIAILVEGLGNNVDLLAEALDSSRKMLQDAYCAQGVTALC